MKYFIISLMLCAVVGCAQKNPFPPDVSGQLQPVNTPSIMQELGNVQN